ncbi:MAG TPA: bifunctional riboflavin kinase/FMN adenylyltransferase [Phycisphaerales bacterium]|nr:bifunctional riboflavin kinase/FMN adenylyltransferase [Phycisphaerales bacterium]
MIALPLDRFAASFPYRPRLGRPTAITIGNFDGVHLGHAALLARCRAHAGNGGRVVALAFDPHPASTLRPGTEPPRLTAFERRRELLLAVGADEVERLEPTPALLAQEPEAFVRALLDRHGPTLIVEGDDFRFGKGRRGDIMMLRTLAAERGCAVEVVGPVEVGLGDHLMVRASSSVTRWLVAHGRVDDARRVLGRPYELEGAVVRGDQLGRTLAIPTANLRTPCLLPADAVYAGVGVLPDGRRMPAAVSVGWRPTVGGRDRRAEVHLLDGRHPEHADWRPLPGLPEYGWRLRVELHRYLRDDLKFPSLDAMMEQIRRDVERVRSVMAASG